MKTIDINCDMGESFGPYTIGQDEAVFAYISSANIACGYHGGDHNVMRKTLEQAQRHGVAAGAHPGLPDRLGFGRRKMEVNPQDVFNMTVYQIGALQAFATVCGISLQHVKPHGALFNMACIDDGLAQAIAEAVVQVDSDLVLFGLAGSKLIQAGRKAGLQVAEEVFADRTYQPDGSLTPRTDPNAQVEDPDEAAYRVIRMVKEGKAEAVDGSTFPIQADTVCVHGDSPQALAFVKKLAQAFKEQDIQIKKVKEH